VAEDVHLREHLSALADIGVVNGPWMTWNTVLAWIPVFLAFALFRVWDYRAPRRTPLWWVGLVLFVLFLPNAPYVLTDLVHLRDDVFMLGPHGRVVTTVMPVYGLLIASGFLAYYLCLAQVTHYLERIGLGHRRGRVVLALHALVAVGVFLGRWSRLNSWEPVSHPRDAIDRVLLALSWQAAPFLILAVFVTTAAGHFVTQAVVEAAGARIESWSLSRGAELRHAGRRATPGSR
jgi:uncharacterized membrane protein